MIERWTVEQLEGKRLKDIAYLLNDMTDRGQRRIEEAQELQETLRDQFEMAILTGLCATQMTRDEMVAISDGTKGGKHFIGCAKRLADAMLEARKTEETTP